MVAAIVVVIIIMAVITAAVITATAVMAAVAATTGTKAREIRVSESGIWIEGGNKLNLGQVAGH